MQVTLLSYSGSDLLCVNAARVSFSKESKEFNDKDAGLINFLAREHHWLPFRHPQVTLRCKAPMFVARQVGKHQVGFSWSEESRRYIKSDPEFYWPKTWRKAAANVKQGSSDEAIDPTIYYGTNGKDGHSDVPWEAAEIAKEAYYHMLKIGVAPEMARMVLPQNMYINWVWTGSLLGWAQLVKQRTEQHAQRETQEFAKLIEAVVQPLYPESWSALKEHL